MTELRTERLLLRPWRAEDRAPFAALNADPEAMAHFPAPLDRVASDALAGRAERTVADRGWGLWAVEVICGAPFIGFIGLAEPTFDAPFAPCVEVGWRLAREQWGHGYATEGAAACLRFAFDALGLEEVVSFTTVGNTKSRRVMEKLGMVRSPADDFDHPAMPAGSPHRRHVLYRISAARWRAVDRRPAD